MDWPPGLSGRDAPAPSSAFGLSGRRTLRAERRFATLPDLGPQEGQQVGVELLLVCAHEAVGRARIDLQGRVLDDLRGEKGRVTDRHDLVVITVDDQGRNVELLEVLRHVRLGEGLDAVECAFETDLHRPQPERVPEALRHLGARPVGAVEGGAEILVELRAVRADAGADLVERLDWRAAWIGLRLQHQWRHRAYQHGLGQARGAVAADVAGHLTAAGGMADQHRLVQIERVEERRQIVSVGVHVVTVPGLAGSAMAATVVGDRAIAMGGHEDQLVVPIVGIERPAVAEDDGLPRAPVLIKDMGAILCGNGARAHGMNSSFQDQPGCESSDSMVAHTLWRTPKFLACNAYDSCFQQVRQVNIQRSSKLYLLWLRFHRSLDIV